MGLYKKGHRNKTHYSGHLKLSIALHARSVETERTATTKNVGTLTDACSMNAAPAMAMVGYCRGTSQLGPATDAQ